MLDIEWYWMKRYRETLAEAKQMLAFIQYLPSFIWATGVIENNHSADKLYMRDDV